MEIFLKILDILTYVVLVGVVIGFFALLALNGAQRNIIKTQRKLINEYRTYNEDLKEVIQALEENNQDQKMTISAQDQFLNGTD